MDFLVRPVQGDVAGGMVIAVLDMPPRPRPSSDHQAEDQAMGASTGLHWNRHSLQEQADAADLQVGAGDADHHAEDDRDQQTS